MTEEAWAVQRQSAQVGDVTILVWRHADGAGVEVRCGDGPPRQVWAPARCTPLDDEYRGTDADGPICPGCHHEVSKPTNRVQAHDGSTLAEFCDRCFDRLASGGQYKLTDVGLEAIPAIRGTDADRSGGA